MSPQVGDVVRWVGVPAATVIATHDGEDGNEYLWCVYNGVPSTIQVRYVEVVSEAGR